jgi:uncharacterized protein YigA (DUF484 family)
VDRNVSEEWEAPNLELAVAVWLRHHPDFFTRHRELVESLRVPHPCRPAVSLLEYQNRLLRERNQRLHDKLLELVAIARTNDRLAERVQRLALNLLDAPGEPDPLLHAIKVVLRDEFNADRAALCLALPAAARWRIAAEFLCPEVVAVFEELFRGGQPQCGRLRPEQDTFLFGDSASPVASAALIPLGTGDWRGMLALGSWDPERFHSGAGTLFLGRVGELVSQALQARLLPGHRKVNFHAAS